MVCLFNDIKYAQALYIKVSLKQSKLSFMINVKMGDRQQHGWSVSGSTQSVNWSVSMCGSHPLSDPIDTFG